MRKYTINFFNIVLLLGLLTQIGFAREVTVASITNGGTIDGLPQAIIADSTGRSDVLPEITTYVLENAGIYPCVTEIKNSDFFLHIRTDDLNGAKARLVKSEKANGGFNRHLRFENDGLIENLIISGLEVPYEGAGIQARRQNIRLYDGARVTVRNCEVSHDRDGVAFSIWSDDCSLFLEDVFMHSAGHHKNLGGNGRFISVRGNMDTLSVVNCTAFNLTDRIFRNMGADVQYTRVDHCTFINNSGFHGGLQLSRSHEVEVTNNVFYNQILLGSDTSRVAGGSANEQTQPENTLMHVLTIDTVFADSKITIQNNNVAWEQQYKDLWASVARTEAPAVITATLTGENTVEPAFLDEVLSFVSPPPSVYEYIQTVLTAPETDPLPENWFFGSRDEVDLSYGTSAASYTAAHGGFPLGDLNHYPARKADWEAAGRPVTSIESISNIAASFKMSQNYPNPFNPATVINFTIAKASKVKLAVYSVLGQEVEVLVDNNMNAGTYKATWDATNHSTGVYFYTITTKDFTSTKKMLLVK